MHVSKSVRRPGNLTVPPGPR